MARNLILVLGDQLSDTLASLRQGSSKDDVVVMIEAGREARYAPYHKKKLAFVFSAMRHFARSLNDKGWTVDYVELLDPNNSQSLLEELARAVARHKPSGLILTFPGKWSLLESFRQFAEQASCDVQILEDDRFFCSLKAFEAWADGRKSLILEHFYREMRKREGLLMNGSSPAGGRWNFDKDNRKPPPGSHRSPGPLRFEPDDITRDVLSLVDRVFPDNFGNLEPFWFAVTRNQAEEAFDCFVKQSLACFGDYQDAMLRGERFLFHSVISMYLNVGLLDPVSVCRRVDAAYCAGDVPINAAEGFIRQILGWREFVRGLYWRQMPEYLELNYFDHKKDLPEFYWSGETDMACLSQTIRQTREEAYAHHIQRLMVTGTFALLAGIDPRQVHEWYLSVYADAFEWVEVPNTLGMSQFADGGLVATKPYAASGAYINRMSDYCGSCVYNVKAKTDENACPFNYLYWDFLARHEKKLRGNPRLSMIYKTWERRSASQKLAVRKRAEAFLARL